MERFGTSCPAGRLAAHLTGVCVAIEHGGDASLQRAVQQWLDRTRELAKPAVPAARGQVTIDDVIAAAPEARRPAIERWAASAWDAWAEHQALATGWISAARGG